MSIPARFGTREKAESMANKLRSASAQQYYNIDTGRMNKPASAKKKGDFINHQHHFFTSDEQAYNDFLWLVREHLELQPSQSESTSEPVNFEKELASLATAGLTELANGAVELLFGKRPTAKASPAVTRPRSTPMLSPVSSSTPRSASAPVSSSTPRSASISKGGVVRDLRPISQETRIQIWLRDVGDRFFGTCWCCNDPLNFTTFMAGHIKSRDKGGSVEADNLRVVCKRCNTDMSTTHMFLYMLFHGLPGCERIDHNHPDYQLCCDEAALIRDGVVKLNEMESTGAINTSDAKKLRRDMLSNRVGTMRRIEAAGRVSLMDSQPDSR